MMTVYLHSRKTPFASALQAGLIKSGVPVTQAGADAEVLLILPSPSVAGDADGHYPHAILEELPDIRQFPQVRRIILVSSTEVYGHGDYLCGDCGPIREARRYEKHLELKRWELFCPYCKEMLMPTPTREVSTPAPLTDWGLRLLALEKQVEGYCYQSAASVTVLRVSYPYWTEPTYLALHPASPLAHFCHTLLADQAATLFEDGYQMRDMTHIDDIIQAISAVAHHPYPPNPVYNIGSGTRLTLQEMVAHCQDALGKTETPYVFSSMILHDQPRHSFPEIERARLELGYAPSVSILEGIYRLGQALNQTASLPN